MPANERKCIKQFLDALQNRYTALVDSNILSYLGVLNKVMEFDILEKIVSHLFDWQSQVAVALFPDQPPPPLPTREEVKSWKEVPSEHDLIPLITYIADSGAVAEAYEELFGCGGTILYISAHEEKQLMAKTKEVFGHRISNPCLQFMNCLPVLEIDTLREATSHQFKAFHSAIGLYIGESMRYSGIIIISDKTLDIEIADLVYLLPNGRKRGRSSIHDGF
jgi:hypothetical protein